MIQRVTLQDNPWDLLRKMDLLTDSFSGLLADRQRVPGTAGPSERTHFPALNLWSSESGLVVDAELPGIDPKETKITVEGEKLTIEGSVPGAEPAENATCHLKERTHGAFRRSVRLPFQAAPESVSASYQNGILRIVVPRAEKDQPKTVTIECD